MVAFVPAQEMCAKFGGDSLAEMGANYTAYQARVMGRTAK